MENSRQNDSPGDFWSSPLLWKILFFSVLIGYCIYYAPYGVNETDGGFLTGLAWQVLSGKALYGEIIYVRPPLPIWLRAGELLLLPDHFTILGERWIFYLKVGAYSWLGAAILTSGSQRWVLATLGLVASAHCYPPMAWHTADGILFSVLGIFFLVKMPGWRGAFLAGIFIFAALLCKQSFYPMAVVFAGLLLSHPTALSRRMAWGIGSFFLCSALFFSYLYSNDLLENYFRMTRGSTSGGQALQHGVFDFFRIKPVVAVPSLLLLAPVAWNFWKRKNAHLAVWCWAVWLVLLVASYALEIWKRQEFTAPFAQARLLFWVGLAFTILSNWQILLRKAQLSESFQLLESLSAQLLSLLAVSWCAAVSWGYNLPILFATPGVFTAMEISKNLRQQAYPRLRLKWLNLCSLIILLAVFRLGYEFVYRDGRRSEMNTHLGEIFPPLGGIYSTSEKARLYSDLKNLAVRYPNFKTLPAFPQANFLTKTRPPFPLDWVVKRETNGDNALILKNLKENRPVLFIERKYAASLQTDPELSLTRDLLNSGTVLDETPSFWVVKPQ